MKKVIFVILALCFVSYLAFAQEAAKSDKAAAKTDTTGVVVVSDETKTDEAAATDETKTLEEEKAAVEKAKADAENK